MSAYLIELAPNDFKRVPEERILLNYTTVIRRTHYMPAPLAALIAAKEPCQIERTRTMARRKRFEIMGSERLRTEGRSRF